MIKKIFVIGGGPAGMMAAIKASKRGYQVELFEKKERLGKKLAITGKGRCNITNSASKKEFFDNIFPKPRFLKTAFYDFFNQDIIDFLEKRGLKTKEERGGRIFPKSNKAEDVVKVFHKELKDLDVKIHLKSKLNKIVVEDGSFKGIEIIKNGSKDFLTADKLILATGGASYKGTGSDGESYKLIEQIGHNIKDLKPALVPMELEGNFFKKVQGLKLKNVTASLWKGDKKISEEFGEMLFSHFGVTGPIILTLSRKVSENLSENHSLFLKIDMKPAVSNKKFDRSLLEDFRLNHNKKIKNLLRKITLNKLADEILSVNEINPDKSAGNLSAEERKKIRLSFKEMKFKIKGLRPLNEAIVTMGGIDLDEVNSSSMESKLIKNIYFCGEMLNIDANTGGFNLQIAYSTGYLAGKKV